MLDALLVFIMMFYQILLSFFILLYELHKLLFDRLGMTIPAFEVSSKQDKFRSFLFFISIAILCIIIF